jgi:hypothetical protein
MKTIKNIIKSIIRLIINLVKQFMTWRYRTQVASQFMDDDFIVLKKSSYLKEIKENNLNKSEKSNSIQTIISTLPNVHYEFRTEEWLWSETLYPYYEMLSRLLKPLRVLEIGALQGFSLIALLRGYDYVESVYWIDNESYLDNSNQMCLENIDFYFTTFSNKKELPDIKFFNNLQAFSKRSSEQQKFDIIHIDGEHTYEGKLRDLDFCFKLKPKYLIVDDYYYHSCNCEAINQWAKTLELNFFVIDTYKRGLAFFDLSNSQTAFSILKNSRILIKEIISNK